MREFLDDSLELQRRGNVAWQLSNRVRIRIFPAPLISAFFSSCIFPSMVDLPH